MTALDFDIWPYETLYRLDSMFYVKGYLPMKCMKQNLFTVRFQLVFLISFTFIYQGIKRKVMAHSSFNIPD